jgi:DNA polymerase-1
MVRKVDKVPVIALIDGDIVAYKAATVSQKSIRWEDGLWTVHADENVALDIATEKIESIRKELKADEIFLCFSDKENFRKKILPTYKANRIDKGKPINLLAVRELLEKTYKSYTLERLEADDVLGIMATSPKLIGDKIVVSLDKDLRQIPTKVYNPDTKKMLDVTLDLSKRWHFMQMLMGDASDGYTGCPKVGAVGAEKILEEGVTWENVLKAFTKAGLGEEDALVQARVSYILKYPDYIKGKIKLWKPEDK